MAWNDGCQPRPPVAEGARIVRFDWAAADAAGTAIEHASTMAVANADARDQLTGALLGEWTGPHRDEFDAERAELHAVIRGGGLDTALSGLRSAWDAAVAGQLAENRRVADEHPTVL